MKQRDDLASPAWLNGQTIAIVSTVLTVGLGIGAMVFSATSSIRGEVLSIRGEVLGLAAEIGDTRESLAAEIKATRSELSDQIEALRSELSDKIEALRLELSAEIEAVRSELSAEIKGLDARLRIVEQDVARIHARLAVRRPLTHGTSPLDGEEHGAGT